MKNDHKTNGIKIYNNITKLYNTGNESNETLNERKPKKKKKETHTETTVQIKFNSDNNKKGRP